MIHKNPIFQRELRGSVRDPKVVMLIVGFVAILGAILVFLWPSTGVFSNVGDSSKQVFGIFLMSNLALIILLVPALTSPSITTERENNSFDLLFTSLLTPGEVLRGKLFSAITMILLVVMVSMAVSAVCALSGGLSIMLLIRAYSVIVMAALAYGMISLAFSAICRKTFSAVMLSYGAVALLAGSTWLPYALLGRIYELRAFWLFLRSLSPFDALYSLLFPSRHGLSQLSTFSDNPLLTYYVHMLGMAIVLVVSLGIFIRYVLTTPQAGTLYRWLFAATAAILGLAVAIQVFAMRGFSNNIGDPASGNNAFTLLLISGAVDCLLGFLLYVLWGKIRRKNLHENQFTDTRTLVKRKLTWPFYIFDPLKRKKPISNWRNPVFVAEMRSKVFGKPRFILWALASCIIVSMLLLVFMTLQYAGNFDNPDLVRVVAVVFQIAIVAILAPAIASGSVTDEMTSRTFGMLRMTPLSAVTVVLGKLKAGFLYVSIFLVSSLPILLSLAYLDLTQEEFNWFSLLRVGIWLAILVLTTLAFITAGFCASAFAKSTSSATAISYTFAAVICIVSLAAVIPGAFEPDSRSAILTVNPVVAAIRVTSDSMFADLSNQIWVHNLAFLGGISALFIVLSAIRVYFIFTRRT